jgi:hypothetical protein
MARAPSGPVASGARNARSGSTQRAATRSAPAFAVAAPSATMTSEAASGFLSRARRRSATLRRSYGISGMSTASARTAKSRLAARTTPTTTAGTPGTHAPSTYTAIRLGAALVAMTPSPRRGVVSSR